MTFGIPKSLLPIDSQGNLINSVIENYKNERIRIEEQRRMDSLGVIDFPSPEDILLGRGRPYQGYSGNLKLAEIIESHRRVYQQARRFDKTCIAMQIVNTIKMNKGRFLQRQAGGGGWVEVDDAIAREKVSSGFRTRTRKAEAATENEEKLDADQSFELHVPKRFKVETVLPFLATELPSSSNLWK